jgi:hypothetical protein
MKVSDEIIWKAVDGQILLLNPVTGFYFSLNDTAADIWNLLVAGKSLGAIAALLSEKYEMPPDVVEVDIKELVASLQSEKLIVVE